MSELTDDQFMNLGVPPPSEMNDDQFMSLGSQSKEQSLTKQDLAGQAVANPDTGLAARLTAYGANAASQIPGMKELGSAEAAALGSGQGSTFGERYSDLEAAQKAMREAGRKTDPGATTLGDISSNVLGIGLGGKLASEAAPGATAFFTNYAKVHPYLASEAVGVPTSALYGFANGDDTASRISNAGVSAGIASVASPLVTAASRNIVEPAIGRLVEGARSALGYPSAVNSSGFVAPSTSAEARAAAQADYALADQKGGTLAPQFTNKFIDEAQKVMPQTQAGKIVAGESPAAQLVGRLDALRDKPLSLQEAQEVDEALGDHIDSFVDKTTGRLTKEGKKLFDIQTSFRNMLENPDPGDIVGGAEGLEAWKSGQQKWAQAARMGDIERIMNRAEMMDNPATSYRSGFRTLASNPNRMRGFSDDEKDLINRAAKASLPAEAMRTLGSRLLSIAGVSTGHPAVALGTQLGTAAARSAAGAMQASRAQDVIDAIANRRNPTPTMLPSSTSSFLAPIAGVEGENSLRPSQKYGGRTGYKTGGQVNTNPTDAQKEAGNYKKDHRRVYGLDITIENPKGSIRRGVDRNGKKWAIKMPLAYGYIKGTISKDKDHLDVYVGDKLGIPKVWVIDQLHADTGKFDEHKAFIGLKNKGAVLKAYHQAFSDGRANDRIGGITELSIDKFKKWLKEGNTFKPMREAA